MQHGRVLGAKSLRGMTWCSPGQCAAWRSSRPRCYKGPSVRRDETGPSAIQCCYAARGDRWRDQPTALPRSNVGAGTVAAAWRPTYSGREGRTADQKTSRRFRRWKDLRSSHQQLMAEAPVIPSSFDLISSTWPNGHTWSSRPPEHTKSSCPFLRRATVGQP